MPPPSQPICKDIRMQVIYWTKKGMPRLLEYIELMCIEAHLEAHVLDLYIPTHLGLEEYTNYSRHYGILV